MFYIFYPFLTTLLTVPRNLKLNLVYLPCNQPHSESHTDEHPDLWSEEVVMYSLVRHTAPQVAMIDNCTAVINN